MKLIKKIAVSIIVMLLALAMGTSVFAATNPVTFGLSEYRRETNGKQYGYRINNGNKRVWKVIVYENDGTTMNFDNTIYCLKAEKGFYTATPNSFKQTYDKMVDFADKSNLVPAIFENDDYYYAATWILDHAYIPYYAKSGDSVEVQNQKKAQAAQDREDLLNASGMSESLKKELTDDDIDVVQQMALWYFTNTKSDENADIYHVDFAGEPSFQEIAIAEKGVGSYTTMADVNQTRADAMEKLYQYMVKTAKSTENIEYYKTHNGKVEEPITLDSTLNPTVELDGSNYIVGPYKINKNNDTPYTLNVKVTDRNGNDLTGKYTLLDSNKADITDKTITDLVGQTFYLKISADTVVADSIDGIKFSMSGTYTTTTATYWTSSTNNTVQPIVVIERTPQEFTDNNEVFFTVSGKYSFKLVKVDSNDATKKLQGVEFEITTPTGTQNYTTDENGEINIADVEITNPGVDTITIKETKAPEPYKILLEEPLVLNVTKDLLNGSYTATDAELEGYDENAVQIQDGVVTITVANEPKIFDLALKKWVSKAIVTNEDGSQTVTETGNTGDEDPEPPAKVDLGRQDINNVTVKFEFQIKITNEGEVAGYATEITDYIPEGLRFVQEDNPDWYTREALDGRERVATKLLENTLLQPGESATVSLILTWINGQDNMGLKTNIAEISQDDNEYDLPDIDSTPDNFKDGEDDIDDAPVILTVALGDTVLYIGVAALAVVVLTAGIFIIKKYAI